MTDLRAIREKFPAVKKHAYFMTNSLGAMPNTVGAALQRMTDVWVEKGADAWEDWVPLSSKVADQVGRLIGAPAGSVAMHLNVSSLMAMLLSTYDFKTKRNKIVYTEMDFPTLHYLADTWRGYGARLHMVRSRDGIGVDLQEFCDAIDEETLIVPTCHAFFGSSFLQDIGTITKRAHQVGAQVCVDLYQSAGAMPVDVTRWNVDFAVGGSHKYFCGGTGAGYLYVRPDHQARLQPRVTGWLSHRAAFDMRMDPMDWAAGMQRWMGGTPAVAPLYVAPCGYDVLEQVGLETIRKTSLAHTDRLIAGADRLGLEVRSPRNPAERAGCVHLNFKGVEKAQAALKERGFLVHYRTAYQGLRVAPHFYNVESEIDGLIEAIEELTRGESRGH